MTWIKLEDSFPDHPKISQLSDKAFRVHISALCYCGKYLTDGVIPAPIANRLCVNNGSRVIKRLVEIGLWSRVEGGYEINDYLKYQTSKAQAEMEKETNRLRATKAREAKSAAQRNGVSSVGVTLTNTHTPTPTPTDNKKKKILVIKDDPINDPDFKVFWMAYPKKVKKAPAAKSYAKALKKATPDEIFKGLVTYSRTCGTDPKFIANPDSWLNQERWNDINPQPKVEGSHSQSSNQFEASEATPTPPKFTIEDVKAPTKPFKSWRELAGESK